MVREKIILRTPVRKIIFSRTPQTFSENFSLFGSKKVFVNRLPKGNFRGYAYPPKFSQASRRPKSRHPLLGGYAQKLFCVPRYAKTFSRTCYAHLGGTLVPKHRVKIIGECEKCQVSRRDLSRDLGDRNLLHNALAMARPRCLTVATHAGTDCKR